MACRSSLESDKLITIGLDSSDGATLGAATGGGGGAGEEGASGTMGGSKLSSGSLTCNAAEVCLSDDTTDDGA